MSWELTDFSDRLEQHFAMPQIELPGFWDLVKAIFV